MSELRFELITDAMNGLTPEMWSDDVDEGNFTLKPGEFVPPIEKRVSHAIANRTFRAATMALACSFALNMHSGIETEEQFVESLRQTLDSPNSFDEWLDCIPDLKVNVMSSDSSDTPSEMKVNLSELVARDKLLFIGAIGMLSMAMDDGFAEYLEIDQEEVVNFVVDNILGRYVMTVTQVAREFDGNPVMMDLAGMPSRDKNGAPINNMLDWIKVYLDESSQLGEDAVFTEFGYGVNFGDAKTDSLRISLARRCLEELGLISDDENFGIKDRRLGSLAYESNKQALLGILLYLIQNNPSEEGDIEQSDDLAFTNIMELFKSGSSVVDDMVSEINRKLNSTI